MFIAPVRAGEIETKAQICASCHGAVGGAERSGDPGHLGPERGLSLLATARHQARRAQSRGDGADIGTAREAGPTGAGSVFLDQILARSRPAECVGCGHAQRVTGEWLRSVAPVATSPTISPRVPCRGLPASSAAYLAKTMLDFRTGVRANNPGMTDLMNAADPADLTALASYLSGL